MLFRGVFGTPLSSVASGRSVAGSACFLVAVWAVPAGPGGLFWSFCWIHFGIFFGIFFVVAAVPRGRLIFYLFLKAFEFILKLFSLSGDLACNQGTKFRGGEVNIFHCNSSVMSSGCI